MRTCLEQALQRLAEITDCDVRSCINTMQFLAKQGRRIVLSDVLKLNIGQKDARAHAFDVWTRLLSSKVDTSDPD